MNDAQRSSGWSRWIVTPCAMVLLYILSSGPMLAICFRLREATGRDEFYAIMYAYYPLLILDHDNPLSVSMEWWVVDVFQTVGPG